MTRADGLEIASRLMCEKPNFWPTFGCITEDFNLFHSTYKRIESIMATEALDAKAVSRDLFSASIGSVACCYVGQPFDTVKVRMQTRPDQFTGIYTTATSMLSNEGIASLWKGAVPTAGGMILENCMAFGVNEGLKRAFPDTEGDSSGPPSLLKPFLMGSITGCFSATVLLPSEVVKAKTQVSVKKVSSSDIVRQMIKSQGMKSMFVGFDAQLCRDASFYAFFFGGYDLFVYGFKTYFPNMPEELNYFISGGLAGMFGWTMAMPFDVPKTNLQSRYDTKVFGSYFPELFKIGRERGLTGLYSGLGPTLVRAFPANAALFLGVEMGKKFFDSLMAQ